MKVCRTEQIKLHSPGARIPDSVTARKTNRSAAICLLLREGGKEIGWECEKCRSGRTIKINLLLTRLLGWRVIPLAAHLSIIEKLF